MGRTERRARSRAQKRPNRTLPRKILFRYIQKSDRRSANLQRILEDFDATPVARKQIKDILDQLVKDGKLAQASRQSLRSQLARNLVDGTIVLHRDGYGFVIPKEKDRRSRKRHLHTSVDDRLRQ